MQQLKRFKRNNRTKIKDINLNAMHQFKHGHVFVLLLFMVCYAQCIRAQNNIPDENSYLTLVTEKYPGIKSFANLRKETNNQSFIFNTDLLIHGKKGFSIQVPEKIKFLKASSFSIAGDFNHAYSVDTSILPKSPILSQQVDLFVWGGQSNAQGWKGDGSFYPVDSNHLDQFIGLNYTFVGNTSSSGNWIFMQPQSGRFPKGHFGPEVSFSRKIKESGANPAIFKFTRGSSSIYNFWKSPGSGGEYDSLIVNLYKAIQVLEQKGYHVTIRGLVWIQGESDAENSTMANAYQASLENMIHDFRTRVAKNKQLPVILGVDEQHMWVVKNPVIVEAQKKIAASLPNVQFTSMIGLPKDDGTHLTPAGLFMHGIRIYEAYICVKNNLQKK